MIVKNRKAQVWVETVIYTLIGLTIIGILLGVSKPKIDSMKDKLLIEQTIDSLNNVNDKIYEVQRAAGNKRVVELKVSKGKFLIDGINNRITWVLDSKYEYSQPDLEVAAGNMKILTKESSPWEVTIWMDYQVDLTYDGDDVIKELDSAPSPYSIYVENMGTSEESVVVDLRVG